jgi:hypothetical protein
MSDPYSVLLLLAIAALAAAWAAVVVARRSPAGGRAAAWAARLALGALALDLASLAVHLATGHRPGGAEAMAAAGFLRAHPAFSVVAALALAALVLRPRRASGPPRR